VGSILVVDDERSLREFLSICLSRAGHKVIAADAPAVALKSLAAHPVDLVITDLKMPGPMDGLALLDEVKKRTPEVQVVVMTAFATTETAIAALKRGAYDYLTKPVKVDEIQVVVERALERQALVRDNATLRSKVQDAYKLASLLGRSAPSTSSERSLPPRPTSSSLERAGPAKSSWHAPSTRRDNARASPSSPSIVAPSLTPSSRASSSAT
jgi:two-component system response regulator PilR (NtrC family)